jgi:hypothetical protein
LAAALRHGDRSHANDAGDDRERSAHAGKDNIGGDGNLWRGILWRGPAMRSVTLAVVLALTAAASASA